NELVAAGRTGHDRDQLPAVVSPVVEDLLGRVDEQRNGRVLPLVHAPTLRRALMGDPGRVCSSSVTKNGSQHPVRAGDRPTRRGWLRRLGAAAAQEALALELVQPAP